MDPVIDLQQCASVDGYFVLSGDVEMRVEPRNGGYTARVHADGLRLVSEEASTPRRDPAEKRCSRE